MARHGVAALDEPRENQRARVLVFPCGTEIGLEIHRALTRSTHVIPVGASSIESHHGRMLFKEHVDGIPFFDDPELVPALNAVIQEHKIDLLYPAHDELLPVLSGNADIACPVVGSPSETAALCRSKSATYRHLAGKVRVPQCYSREDDYPLPIFLKPDRGQGSKGIVLAPTRAQAEAALERDPSRLLMEYLPGTEYTVDCFTDASGALRFAAARERIRRVNGIAVHTVEVDLPEARTMAEAINAALALRGAWFFQVKQNTEGALVLMEVAPRVSGSMGLFRCQGVNLPLLSVFDALERPIHILHQPNLKLDMDRALISRYHGVPHYTRVYMDLDDTLLHNGKLDPMAVAFVVQCRNRGVRVHLLSRHVNPIDMTLERLGIRSLFSDVTHLTRGQRKSEWVVEPNAIFIDDSFAERREVFEARGIPVFALDALESLLDWRTG